MKKIVSFAIDFVSYVLKGGKGYYAWLLFLLFFILVGVFTSLKQFTTGLIVTGATDQIIWEFYLSNFIFTAHIAAAAILVVIPGYIYKHKHMKGLVVFGEIIALSFVFMGILFVLFHMGRPDRLWHLIPGIGYFNLPYAMLPVDTVVLNTYLFLNAVAVFYLLYKKYMGQPMNTKFYTPLIWLAVSWGPLIHIVTAFVLSSLARVHAWNTAILPIAFLSMAAASGPSLIIMIFLIIRKYTQLFIHDDVIDLLSQIVIWALGIVILVFSFEIFTELYADTEHAASLKYNMFGIPGHREFVPWFWITMTSIVASFVLLLIPKIRKSYNRFLPLVCAVVFLVILIEKPVVLVLPAFSPTPLGEYAEYHVTLIEWFNTLFVWAMALFGLTLTAKGAIGVLLGEVRHPDAPPLVSEVAAHAE